MQTGKCDIRYEINKYEYTLTFFATPSIFTHAPSPLHYHSIPKPTSVICNKCIRVHTHTYTAHTKTHTSMHPNIYNDINTLSYNLQCHNFYKDDFVCLHSYRTRVYETKQILLCERSNSNSSL